jgi:hypothetical protein
MSGTRPHFKSADQLEQDDEWLSCGAKGCSLKRDSNSPDGYPQIIGMGCFRVKVLSKEHILLIMNFMYSPIAAVLACLLVPPHPLVPLCHLLTMSCAFMVLRSFQDLDLVQQLERECKTLENRNREVEEEKQRMNDFWKQVQELTDLWLHRTVPRLELMKEVHNHLEDSQEEDIIPKLAAANGSLENLEDSIGALSSWRGDETISEKGKQTFGIFVQECYKEPDFNALVGKVNLLSAQKLPELKDMETNWTSSDKGSGASNKCMLMALEDPASAPRALTPGSTRPHIPTLKLAPFGAPP